MVVNDITGQIWCRGEWPVLEERVKKRERGKRQVYGKREM